MCALVTCGFHIKSSLFKEPKHGGALSNFTLFMGEHTAEKVVHLLFCFAQIGTDDGGGSISAPYLWPSQTIDTLTP